MIDRKRLRTSPPLQAGPAQSLGDRSQGGVVVYLSDVCMHFSFLLASDVCSCHERLRHREDDVSHSSREERPARPAALATPHDAAGAGPGSAPRAIATCSTVLQYQTRGADAHFIERNGHRMDTLHPVALTHFRHERRFPLRTSLAPSSFTLALSMSHHAQHHHRH